MQNTKTWLAPSLRWPLNYRLLQPAAGLVFGHRGGHSHKRNGWNLNNMPTERSAEVHHCTEGPWIIQAMMVFNPVKLRVLVARLSPPAWCDCRHISVLQNSWGMQDLFIIATASNTCASYMMRRITHKRVHPIQGRPPKHSAKRSSGRSKVKHSNLYA